MIIARQINVRRALKSMPKHKESFKKFTIPQSALVLVTRTGVLTGQMGKGLKSIWRYTLRRTLILATSELACMTGAL